MNVFLLTDLEGIGGVTDIEFIDKTNPKYQTACRLLEESINEAVDACFASGADRVYYLDGHAGGGNVREEQIDRRAVKCDIAKWQELLQTGEIDCQIELGSHARAGTRGGFLDHTVSSKAWFCHRVNGREMSELSMHALVCGAYGVPVVACIGDETACEQAREYIPAIYTGALKRATCRNKAIGYEGASGILRRTVCEALANYQRVEPFFMEGDAVVELTFYRTDMCEKALDRCDETVRRVDARTLCRTVKSITKYEDLKF